MQSYVMTDSRRIEEVLGALCSFGHNDDGTILWMNNGDSAYRFVVVDDVLVIGTMCDHTELFAAWMLRDEPNNAYIGTKTKAICDKQFGCRHPSVTGAGIVNSKGEITGWKSVGLDVMTPWEMRDAVSEEVARLFKNGALQPR